MVNELDPRQKRQPAAESIPRVETKKARALQRAAMVAILGHPLLTKDQVPPQWQDEYDDLHKPSKVREAWAIMGEIDAIGEKRGTVPWRGKSFQFYSGVEDALEASTQTYGPGFILRAVETISESNLIQHLARAKSNRILLDADLVDPRVKTSIYELNGRIAGFEWVLGRKDSLSFKGPEKPQVVPVA